MITNFAVTQFPLFSINELTLAFLHKMGINAQTDSVINIVVLIIIATISIVLLQFIANKLASWLLKRISRKTGFSFFKYSLEHNLQRYIAYILSLSSLTIIASGVIHGELLKVVLKILYILIVIMISGSIVAVAKSVVDVLRAKPSFKHKPFKGYIQVVQVALFVIAGIIIYSILTDRKMVTILATLGAASALMLLLFQSTIAGFIASIQVTSNNMLEIGDRIVIDKFGANGTVEEMTLTTVKIRNLDGTTCTVPTQSLINDSFVNWNSIVKDDIRRFTRSMDIKQSTIKWLSDEQLEQYKEIDGLTEYIEYKKRENKEFNKGSEHPDNDLNRLGITNISLFVAYMSWFLKHHPSISKKNTAMARQLVPSEFGSTVEIYAFTNMYDWEAHEIIVADVFNHMILATEFFGLEIHEPFAMSDDVQVKMVE